MPDPMPSNFNFYIEHKNWGTGYEMPFMQAASNYYEIGYGLSGDRISITPTYSCIMRPGDICVLAPYTYHKSIALTDMPYDRFLIKFTLDFAQTFIDTVGRNTFDTFYSKRVHKIDGRTQNHIITHLEKMQELFLSDTEYKEFHLKCMLYDLFMTVMEKELPDEESTIHHTPLTPPIIDALQYMEQNYDKNPSLEDAAKISGYSPSYFSRLFQTQLGKSFSDYLINIRLGYVQYLLLNTQKSITEIALETGYSHTSNLSEQFKKYTGLTPLQYRKGKLMKHGGFEPEKISPKKPQFYEPFKFS